MSLSLERQAEIATAYLCDDIVRRKIPVPPFNSTFMRNSVKDILTRPYMKKAGVTEAEALEFISLIVSKMMPKK